ncbi:MAG: acyl-CoA dehydrogenase family protein [Minwuia sp.]|nr:acyl-CoA dehydrogenase family protein [Minwuia sp.]
MDVLLQDTVAYARTRKQFGSPLGKFQALQHRMVDMFVALEQSRALLMQDTDVVASGGAAARKVASAIKVHTSGSARLIGEEAIQIHGGMGTTDDLNIGHYVKRLLAMEVLFGDVDYHLDRYAGLG